MTEGIEKKLPKRIQPESTSIQLVSETMPRKEWLRVTALEKEIKEFIRQYLAEIFNKTKEEKTEGIEGGGKAIMKEYPAEKYDFRKTDWFQNLPPKEKAKIEYKIIEFISQTTQEELQKLYDNFLKNLSPSVQEYFRKNRERIEQKKGCRFLPIKGLKKKVIKAIEDFENQFGFPPDPWALQIDCVQFVNFVGKIAKHYGFKSRPIRIPGHVALLVELEGKKLYVSDKLVSKLLSLREWIKEMEIKPGDAIVGSSTEECESNFYSNLGEFFYDLEHYKEAEERYKKALEKDPNNISALLGLGYLFYWGVGDPSKAKEYFSKAKSISPRIRIPKIDTIE